MYKIENRGVIISSFAHKCEKLKDCESIPGFLNRLKKSFALSDIQSQKEKFRLLDFLIPLSVSAELSKDFNKLEQNRDVPFDEAIEELNEVYCLEKTSIYFLTCSSGSSYANYQSGQVFCYVNIEPSKFLREGKIEMY